MDGGREKGVSQEEGDDYGGGLDRPIWIWIRPCCWEYLLRVDRDDDAFNDGSPEV